ncbi:hypothetical protein TELCIR_03526 [Teladorsagia circumcincta]|uniref:Uncharacterized protein n=1 Tax=Teladorsagia circumcincta TaxID=45464 RepID=A0A2G9UW40_TELCI|nr:hypothetical protein TELCIR_03526 [Teladorsagia circumcincta]
MIAFCSSPDGFGTAVLDELGSYIDIYVGDPVLMSSTLYDDCDERLVIGLQREVSSVDKAMEFLHCEYESEGFLLNLAVVLLCWNKAMACVTNAESVVLDSLEHCVESSVVFVDGPAIDQYVVENFLLLARCSLPFYYDRAVQRIACKDKANSLFRSRG